MHRWSDPGRSPIRDRRALRLVLGGLVALTFVLAGCGANGGGDSPEAVVEDYLAALSDSGGGGKACDLVTEATRKSVVMQMSRRDLVAEDASCEKALALFSRLLTEDHARCLRGATVGKVSVKGKYRLVTARFSDARPLTIAVEKVDDRWYVTGGLLSSYTNC